MDVLFFALALAFLILIHELGHFLAAKALGIEIEEFGIGFPPRVARLFEWRGTVFTLNLIPFGGFVRPKGEGDPSKPDALAQAPPLRRAVVILAGPLMNLLVGGLAYLLIFGLAGAPKDEAVLVWWVEPDSPAQAAGLRPGDLIVAANDTPTPNAQALQKIIRQHRGRPVRLTLQRADQTLTVTAVPRVEPPPGQGALGIRIIDYGWAPVPWPERLRLAATTLVEHTKALIRLPWDMLRAYLSPSAEPPPGEVMGFRGMYTSFQLAFAVDRAAPLPVPVYTLTLIASLSLSLAVLNLLPIPALDGSRLVLALGEWLFRRRLPWRVEFALMLMGFFMLLALMVLVNLREWL